MISDAGLRKMFNYIRKTYFEGQLAGYKISFKKMKDYNGLCDLAKKEIFIDERLRGNYDICFSTVLHETVHAELGPEYVGNNYFKDCRRADHGGRFQARIAKLFAQGAYDGIL